ncbi:MAG TPA: AAA family ATPase, partial [Gaiellaceae bacterium]|nr:AAA family ATPase [Gaiellaceae bacterium]
EKFIGDAVMAVWGTPVATEDDAERAVRAALELVAAVAALGDEVGAPELGARAGVLTGEAAVTLGAVGEGMVAGDLVNTAARIQAAAAPGQVLVGDSTRRAAEQAIVYADAGTHELKGKAEPVQLFRAVRVTSARQGALKSAGLEPPFVGRDRELRLVKDLFHGGAAERRANLVSVTGIAGIGKSRLAWEFYKYFDGLAETVFWHRGRCLAYGDGVTYWALADMIRMRAGIGEEDGAEAARAKLRDCLEEHVPDADERAFVEPRLAHLLGLEEHASRDKQDLFGAWRLFFERLADVNPVVLVFEDVQWADGSLLDFVEYLLDWSRATRLFVLTLGRPELAERRPTWGAGKRNFTSLYLEPLSAEAMGQLLDGFVPGLPDDLRAEILARAEGVPLYAVETVRMLLDRGLLAQEGDVYRVTGEIGALDVPETLHGLIAARLDGLPPEERRLLQDAAVLGKMFTRAGLAAVGDTDEALLEPLLASLARKEVLSLQADPRSPEHGQYGFLQDLVRHVAYETLSRRERRLRHLAAAAYLEAQTEEELAEVIAAHYVEAASALPDADDAEAVRARANTWLTRAGERAESLGATGEAQRYYEQASELAADDLTRAQLLERAGWMSAADSDLPTAERQLSASLPLYLDAGETHQWARTSAKLAFVERWQGRFDDALERLERAWEAVEDDEPDEDVAFIATNLAGAFVFKGRAAEAEPYAMRASQIAEALGDPQALARAFLSRGAVAAGADRPEESLALLERAAAIAREHELFEEQSRAVFLLSDRNFHRDRYE